MFDAATKIIDPLIRLHPTSPISKKLLKRYNKKFAVEPDILYLKIRDIYKEAFITKRFTLNPL